MSEKLFGFLLLAGDWKGRVLVLGVTGAPMSTRINPTHPNHPYTRTTRTPDPPDYEYETRTLAGPMEGFV